MDGFLAEFYNTLGCREGLEKDASEEMSPWGYSWEDLEKLARNNRGKQKRVAVPGSGHSRKARLARAEAEADRVMRQRQSGRGSQGHKVDAFEEADEVMRARQGSRKGGWGEPKAPAAKPTAVAPRPSAPSAPAPKPSAAPAKAGLLSRMGRRWKSMGRGGKAAVIAAPIAAAVGGGALYAHKKKAASDESAFGQLVAGRAYEILAANGLADDYGNVIVPESFEKTAEHDDFDSVVDSAALELLEANGYPVEWD